MTRARFLPAEARPAGVVRRLLATGFCLGAFASAAMSVYLTKRALNVDCFPGVDMLPDEAIMNLIRVVF